jgi:hypothetical protein
MRPWSNPVTRTNPDILTAIAAFDKHLSQGFWEADEAYGDDR